jgi:hypothetical protein
MQCSVPVFFLFDLEKILNMPDTKFSELYQSGYGSPLYSGVEAFSKLDFDKIYSCGPITNELINTVMQSYYTLIILYR